MIDGRRSGQSGSAVCLLRLSSPGLPQAQLWGPRQGDKGGSLLPPPALPRGGPVGSTSFLFRRRAQALAWGSV